MGYLSSSCQCGFTDPAQARQVAGTALGFPPDLDAETLDADPAHLGPETGRHQAGPDLETSLPLTSFNSNERFSASNQGRKVIHRQSCNRTLQATIKTDLALYAHWCIHGGNVTGISDSFLIGFNVYLTRKNSYQVQLTAPRPHGCLGHRLWRGTQG